MVSKAEEARKRRGRKKDDESEEEASADSSEAKPRAKVSAVDGTLSDADSSYLFRRRAWVYGEPGMNESESKFSDLIHNWSLTHAGYLDQGLGRTRSVCRVVHEDDGSLVQGAGILIAPGSLLTSQTLISSPEDAHNTTAIFSDLGADGPESAPYTLNPERLFLSSNHLGFTLVGVDGAPEEKYGTVDLLRDPHRVQNKEFLNLITFKGRTKQVSVRHNEVSDVDPQFISFTSDLKEPLPGTACFNDQWELVGLFVSERPNKAVRCSSVVRFLENLWHVGQDEQARALLKAVTDVNPYEGFFGPSGILFPPDPESPIPYRSIDRLDAATLSKFMYDYRGTQIFVDIAFWDLGNLNRHSSVKRLSGVADVLERSNLDIVGIIGAEGGALEKVVDLLNQRGHNFQLKVKDVRGQQDLAVIHKADSVELEEDGWDDLSLDDFSRRVHDHIERNFDREPFRLKVKTIDRGDTGYQFTLVVADSRDADVDPATRPVDVRAASARILAQALKRQQDREGPFDFVVGGNINLTVGRDEPYKILVDEDRTLLVSEAERNEWRRTTLMVGCPTERVVKVFCPQAINRDHRPKRIPLSVVDYSVTRIIEGTVEEELVPLRLIWDETNVPTRKSSRGLTIEG